MTERPILFQGAMVRALLAGKKTQTRRAAIKTSQPGNVHITDFDAIEAKVEIEHKHKGARYWKQCPYGQPGDRLWVRESWQHHEGGNVHDGAGAVLDSFEPETIYRASQPNYPGPWKPSIHMPRSASRITLEVTGVRVERLQDISIEDAKAEGAWPDVSVVDDCAKYFGIDVLAANPYRAFQMLWERINGVDAWGSNPWVWVVEFQRVQP